VVGFVKIDVSQEDDDEAAEVAPNNVVQLASIQKTGTD
jgi:hypothetical protein